MGNNKAICPLAIFQNILMEDEGTLYKILDEFYDVVIDIDEDKLFELLTENPILNYFFKRENASLIFDNGEFETLNNQEYDKLLNNIIILEDDVDVNKIRSEYGIMAIHNNDKYLENNEYNFGYSFNKRDKVKKTWVDVFGVEKITPINSAIIVDNYLWSDHESFNDDNVNNFYPIFSNLIPKTLKISFHILMVIQNKGGAIIPKKAQEKISKFKRKLEKETGVEIEIGFVSQTDTSTFHERYILTNYHYISSHKGFTVFDKGRVKTETNGERNWVFKDIKNYFGEIRKHQQLRNISNINKLIAKNNKTESSTVFNVGNMDSPILN